MKKILIAAFAALVLAGCTQTVPPSGQGPAISASSGQSAGGGGMAALLPDKAGFRWRYFGFAEYAMTMSLDSIVKSGDSTVYTAEGKVADMSGKEDTSGVFNVKIVYTVSPGVLSQSLTGAKALDADIPGLELIRAPLAQGTQWEQNVLLDGKDAVLECAIDSVKESNGKKVYSVSYRQKGGDYYELRDITEGLGETSFQKLYKYDTGSDLIGYRLDTQDDNAAEDDYKQWLPELGKQYTYFGLAEYGHKGTLTQISGGSGEGVYEYRGVYTDGIGDESKFVVRYYVDLGRGAVTEQVVSNERGKAEVNSKLHNLVILKFPLNLGEKWSNGAKLNGKDVTVQAEVVQYDGAQGIVKVRYTAKGAAGYYNDTYIEERTFEKGFGMTAFSNLMPGGIGISPADAKDAAKLEDAIRQHSFGYSINKQS